MITLSVGAKILPTALSNFEDWPSGPELVLGLSFSIIFSFFSELLYEKEKKQHGILVPSTMQKVAHLK